MPANHWDWTHLSNRAHDGLKLIGRIKKAGTRLETDRVDAVALATVAEHLDCSSRRRILPDPDGRLRLFLRTICGPLALRNALTCGNAPIQTLKRNRPHAERPPVGSHTVDDRGASPVELRLGDQTVIQETPELGQPLSRRGRGR